MKIALILLALATAGLAATASAQEAPVSRTARDADLKWGPCPPFLPKGCEIAVLHGDPAKPNVDNPLQSPGEGLHRAPLAHLR